MIFDIYSKAAPLSKGEVLRVDVKKTYDFVTNDYTGGRLLTEEEVADPT